MTRIDFEAALNAIKGQIAEACKAAGRNGDSVRLLAVSKSQSAASVHELYAQGQLEFGENYAQEMLAKAETLKDLENLRWIYIGTLQSNKIAALVRCAAEIQSVGSLRHARLVADAVAKANKSPYPIYLLVNAGDESTKTGLRMDEVLSVADVIASELPALRLQGLMAIPPADLAAESGVPPLYRKLRDLASKVGEGRLSLGMSQDLQAAIAAGSDCVRIGTALFGPRER